jgi:hypothetical protein
VRAGDEILAGRQVDRAEVVGLELAAGIVDQAAQRLEVAFRFEQGLGRDDDCLPASVRSRARPIQSAVRSCWRREQTTSPT